MCGFAHLLTFAEINDEDINKMEQFMREEALEIAISNLRGNIGQNDESPCDVLLDHEKKAEIFGNKFASCPEKFHLLPGDISCIKLLVTHVKQVVSTRSGRAQFNEKKRKKNKNEIHPLKAHAEQEMTREEPAVSETNNEIFVEELFDKVNNCMKSYGLDIENWNGSLIEIDPSGTYARVYCILCDPDGDGHQNPKRIFYHSSETRKGFWVLSNFSKHLENVHSLVKHPSSRKKPASSIDSNTEPNLLPKRGKTSTHVMSDATDMKQKQKPKHAIEYEYESILPVEKHEMQIKQEFDETNHTLDLSVEIINSTASTNELKNTWLFAQLSDQMQLMIAAVITNGESQKKMEFILNGDSFHLFVVETEDDGNCLFSALAHQLWQHEITSKQHEKMKKNLRSTVVEHILKPENYIFALEERLREKKNIEGNDDLISECKLYVRHCLSRDRQWGGLESIKAVSCVYRVNVVVFNENGACYMIKRSGDEYNRTIAIAYRLRCTGDGEYKLCHYDSISEMDSNSIYSASEFITKK